MFLVGSVWRMRLCVVVCMLFAVGPCVEAGWSGRKTGFGGATTIGLQLRKATTAACLAFGIGLGPIYLPAVNADVTAIAQLTDLEKREKGLELCKDRDARMASGYISGTNCKNDVMNGVYTIVEGGKIKGAPSMPVSKSEVTQRKVESATETASSVGSAPSQTVSAVVSKLEKVSSPEAPKKKEKKQDLSGLPLASKKRRAIAGCKRADLRKEAMMGSESKCTESVMSGNYGPMIDLLEYE